MSLSLNNPFTRATALALSLGALAPTFTTRAFGQQGIVANVAKSPAAAASIPSTLRVIPSENVVTSGSEFTRNNQKVAVGFYVGSNARQHLPAVLTLITNKLRAEGIDINDIQAYEDVKAPSNPDVLGIKFFADGTFYVSDNDKALFDISGIKDAVPGVVKMAKEAKCSAPLQSRVANPNQDAHILDTMACS